MNTVAASVTGARHLRDARNGQDAVATWCSSTSAAAVVCDGCSSGTSSEVGARLGAAFFVRSLAARLAGGADVHDLATWESIRYEVSAALGALVERMTGERTAAIHDHFLFTIVAAAITPTGGAIWALGDGAYALDGTTHTLGPFPDNAPPYLAYDLLGAAHVAYFTPTAARTIVIATDGALELPFAAIAQDAPRYLRHPDALRRHLALCARTPQRIDWDERRVLREPASLQDDCAISILHRPEIAS